MEAITSLPWVPYRGIIDKPWRGNVSRCPGIVPGNACVCGTCPQQAFYNCDCGKAAPYATRVCGGYRRVCADCLPVDERLANGLIPPCKTCGCTTSRSVHTDEDSDYADFYCPLCYAAKVKQKLGY